MEQRHATAATVRERIGGHVRAELGGHVWDRDGLDSETRESLAAFVEREYGISVARAGLGASELRSIASTAAFVSTVGSRLSDELAAAVL